MDNSIYRNEVIRQINYCKNLNSQANYQGSYKHSTNLLPKIMEVNFNPLLTLLLTENLTSSLKLLKYQSIFTDLFMLLSPKLRPQNPSSLFNQLNSFIESQTDILVPFEDKKKFFFPIDVDVRYNLFNIVAGNKPTIKLSLLSHLPKEIEITNLILAFNHENNSHNETMQISGPIDLIPNQIKRISIERNLPPSISKESIVSLKIQFKKIFTQIEIKNALINVIPDEKACKVEAKLPQKCIIGTNLPFQISLTADDQKLLKINALLTTENPSIPLTITGSYNGTDIELGKKFVLPDIEPNYSITLDLLVRTQTPIFNPVVFKYSFGTSLSGTGDFEKHFSFDFQSPFIASLQLYDENYILIRPNETPTIEEDKPLIFEVSLKNNVLIPIKILKIEPESIFEQDNEINILPYEQYTFLGEIKSAGLYDINIEYQTEEIERSVFSLKLPTIQNAVRNFSLDVVYPLSAVLFKEFEIIIKFDRTHNNGNNDPEVCPAMVNIIPSDNFIVQGPLNNHLLYLFKNQIKELTIKIVPLSAGSLLLPEIEIMDLSAPPPKPKKIIKSVVINYR